MKKLFIAIFTLLFIFFIFNSFKGNKQITGSFPKEYIDDRENFRKVNQLLDQVNQTQQPDLKKVTKEDEQKIYSYIEEAMKLSNQIDDKFFDYLDPEFRHYFREKHIKGTEIYYEGLKENNLSKQLEGNKLNQEWIDWWSKNGKSIADKAFP